MFRSFRLSILCSIFFVLLNAFFISPASLAKDNNRLDSLPAKVEVDPYGVAHITANNLKSLFFTFGYISAKDRLFQMDVTRRKARGTLAEIAGRDRLEEDILARSVDFYRSAEKDLALLIGKSPEAETILNAYSEGINSYISDNGLPPEYSILPPFEPWKPIDTLAIARSVGFMLAEDFQSELIRFRLQNAGGTQAENLQKTLDALAKLPLFPIISRKTEPRSGFASASEKALGSNAFVISGKFTDGYPLLANDPHLEITFPSIWYEVWLTLDGKFSVRGASIPGTPLIAIGANEYYAWGITALQADNQDLILIEKEDLPALFDADEIIKSKATFKISEGLRTLEEERTITYIRGLGPVIAEEDGKMLILKWVQETESLEPLGFYLLSTGRTISDFERGISLAQTPYAFLYASRKGDIAFFARGLIPIRDYESSIPQLVNSWSDLQKYKWQFFEPSYLPSVINPDEGYIVSANNPPELDGTGKPTFPGSYSEGTRARRISMLIKQKLANDGKISLEELAEIQRDTYSIYAEQLLPVFVERIKSGKNELSSVEEVVTQALISWNRMMDADEPGALIWRLIEHKLIQTAREKYGALYATYDMTALAIQGSSWFSFTEEDLRDALSFATQNSFSENGTILNYGDRHKIRMIHPLPIYSLASPGEIFASGGFRCVNVSVGSFHDSTFYKDFGATFRMIVDLSSPLERYYSVIPGGQSGDPKSPNFSDQVELYTYNTYKYFNSNG